MASSGFKMKSFGQVIASMVNWFSSAQSQVSDLNVGSVARTILEAVASELGEVYFRIYKAITDAQEEAVYRSFSFDRKPATYGTGTVLWQRTTLPTSPITIPVGSQVAVPATAANPEITFSNSAAYTVPAKTTLAAAISSTTQNTATLTSASNVGVGDILQCESEQMQVTAVNGAVASITRGYNGTTAATHSNGLDIGVVGKAVMVTAVSPGASGNVGANTITKINTAIIGLTSVTNPAGFSGGADQETDDARKKRFNDFISGLARGTKTAIEFGAKQVSGVVSARAVDLDDDPTLNPGYVNLYIADASGGASSTLISAVNTELNNWRPAGVRVTTAAPTVVPVNVTVTLTLDRTFNSTDIVTAVTQRLTDYLTSLRMGDDVFLAILYQVIVDTNPVAILNAQITTPSADTTISASQIARPGTFTINVAS